MGIPHGSNLFWKTIDIGFETALSTIEQMVTSDLETTSGIGRPAAANRPYTVAIDANLIAYKYIGDDSPISPVGSVLKVTRAFIKKATPSS